MDHHCNWLYNCVGYGNYKFFMVFLIYTNFLLLFMFLTYTECISRYYVDNSVSDFKFFIMAFSFFLNMSFVIIIFSFSGFHFAYLVTENRTTLEYCEKSRNHVNYNMGFRTNWINIFGKNPLFWFLPFFPNRDQNPLEFESTKEQRSDADEEGVNLINNL